MKLRKNERCPIHNGYYCCGRERKPSDKRQKSGPVQVLADGRLKCSPAELRRRTLILLKKQNGLCGICGFPISDIRDLVPDHKRPRGMGGAFRDDSWDNLQAAHRVCNGLKGSQHNFSIEDRKALASGERETE